jgi:hypothetical protein
MTLRRPRATGHYGVYNGREYHAAVHGADVILRSYRDEPAPVDFGPSRIPLVQGVRTVARSTLDKLHFVRTVCSWRTEPFLVVGVDGQTLQVFYLGNQGDWACRQPGMVRTGKLETHGRLPITEVDDIVEFVNPLPLGAST